MIFRQASIAFALWALAAPAFGQDVTNPSPPISVNGAYNLSAPTCTDGHGCWLQTDVNGNLKVVSSGSPVAPVGSASIATSQASITTGNISAVAARAGRNAVTITNGTGTGAVYCGVTGVTTSTGTYLGATIGSSITLNTSAAVFCTVAAVTQTVTVVETF
jgi:hypothetical protein